jgi:CDGSH-type Zn-finger protein
MEATPMSLVRMGLSENKKYADGYDAIFGKSPKTKVAAKKPAKKTAVRNNLKPKLKAKAKKK